MKEERSVYQNTLDTAISQVKLLEDSTSRAKKQLELDERELGFLDGIQESKRSELADSEDDLQKCRHRFEEAKTEEKVLEDKENSFAKKKFAVITCLEEAKTAQRMSSC